MSRGPQADQMNLTYMSTEFMNSASRACRSTWCRSIAMPSRLTWGASWWTWRQSGQIL